MAFIRYTIANENATIPSFQKLATIPIAETGI